MFFASRKNATVNNDRDGIALERTEEEGGYFGGQATGRSRVFRFFPQALNCGGNEESIVYRGGGGENLDTTPRTRGLT